MQTYIEKLRSEGILSHIRNNPSKREDGIILIACGDCDRFDELYEFEKNLFRKSELHPRIHVLTLNGGGLLVHPRSPLNSEFSSAQTLIMHAKNSSPLKGINDLIVYSHGPCGAAEGARFSPEDYFKWLAKGADYLARALSKLNVTCNFHNECNSDTKFKSEYFNHTEWLNKNQADAVGV